MSPPDHSSPHRPSLPDPAGFGGVHDPTHFHDGCGVAFVGRLDGRAIHETIDRGLVALDRLEHRGATGADPLTGDGAGIMIGLPHAFFRSHSAEIEGRPAELPLPGRLGVAVCFLRREAGGSVATQRRICELVTEGGHTPIGWRDVPVDESACGEQARASAPEIRQLFIASGEDFDNPEDFERSLYVIRRRAENELGPRVSFPSMSCRTIVFKGMLTAPQLPQFYPDLRDLTLASTFAIVHSRFSTNTAPSWELAQPLRMIAHNGEINTARGNINWMRAREAVLSSESFGDDLRDCLPLIDEDASDSAAFDRALELMVLAGDRTVQHAMMMMIPAAWEGRPDIPAELEGFYRYHGRLMEPWDGPVAIAFCDGRTLGAMLDRNGLRPGRWIVTRDGWVCLGSESGIFTVNPAKIARMGRLEPAQLFTVDLESGLVRTDGEVEVAVAGAAPYGEWYAEGKLGVRELPDPQSTIQPTEPLLKRQLAFGYTQEDLRTLLAPLLRDGREPTGSMGNDLSLAVFSDHRPSLYGYFKQRFAQVTNPAIDSVRESAVMSLRTDIGPQGNLLSTKPQVVNHVALDHPILTDFELERLRRNPHQALHATTIDATWALENGEDGLELALDRLREQALAALHEDTTLLVISDRATGARRVPIPSLLACSTVHHALVREGTRLRAALVVESGEPREIHHLAALIGYGATAINPYLMLETMTLLDEPTVGLDGPLADAQERAIAGIRKGLLKVLSKMGISTIRSYRGAQIFEIIGIDEGVVEEHFTGTPSRLGGIGIGELAAEALDRHARAYPDEHGMELAEHVAHARLPAASEKLLPQGGVYRWRQDGEKHMWDPATISALQHAARTPEGDEAGYRSYEEFSRLVNEENASHTLLRGLLGLRESDTPYELHEVEEAMEIVKRFSTGGMSLGALSPEAHETLAIAMNRIGGFSNSGEGGEDRRRNVADPNGDERRSRIRQIASGRFGVDIDYLSRADQIQIKIAQGAKPGEGGQLPGHKVDDYIGALRFALPGTELISPPPHHDIYSIEDLKQLIYDLRAANPEASVSVKLAAEYGVGTVAVGCVKAGADHLVIAGHDGGTGASPLSSIQAVGVPWELGLAETQQALLESDLRTRVIVQTDGGMRTGRDVVVAAMLGADEVGISTAPLIATGCIMMRVCHLNTCPVGVATQDPELRRRFSGKPEQVVKYLFMVAEEARTLMAALGVKRYGDLVGRTELLIPEAIEHWKAGSLDLRPLLAIPGKAIEAPRGHVRGDAVQRVFGASFDERELIPHSQPAIRDARPVTIERRITNIDLAVGGRLSTALVRERGPAGLPDDTISVGLEGSAGQTFGAWLAPGVTLSLSGDVNDYAGKGLSGGVIAVRPPPDAGYRAERNVIAGNVALYGATKGKAFFRGLAGERFAVRNSGALAVVEGVGEHGCEYMTGGCVVVLGETGRNFAAGMSGGIACIWDPEERFEARCNLEMVELEPVHPDGNEFLRLLIVEHFERTGSTVAEGLLERWEEAVGEFVVVIPPGFRAALMHLEPPAKARTVNLA